MKLKTLKDIARFKLNKVENWSKSKWNDWNETRASKSNIVFDRDLKAEAVKWVKNIENDEGNWVHSVSFATFKTVAYSLSNWIKNFFNITEEDLK